ncbi:unnamed protein product, partial [Symbiodinium sp. CCMP2456]
TSRALCLRGPAPGCSSGRQSCTARAAAPPSSPSEASSSSTGVPPEIATACTTPTARRSP